MRRGLAIQECLQ